LKWRQGNEILAKGKMRHYVPQNGVYVYERYLNGKSILVFMNGTSKEAEIDLDRYAESLKGKSSGFDVLSNQQIHFNSSMKLLPREIHIVEL
jgi:hypothetical protein